MGVRRDNWSEGLIGGRWQKEIWDGTGKNRKAKSERPQVQKANLSYMGV
jgi:hypothetical protein